MKRYVDVIKCYKKKYSFYKKKKSKTSESGVVVVLLPPVCGCDLLEVAAPQRPEADDQNQLNAFFFSNQRHVSPTLPLISKSMTEVSGVKTRVLDLVAG